MQVIKKGIESLAYAPLRLPQVDERGATMTSVGGIADRSANPVIETFVPPTLMPARQAPPQQLSQQLPQEDPGLLVEQARAEAAQIIADANARVGEIERTARENAVAEVRASFAEEAAAEAAALRMQLTQSLEEIAELREQMATYAEREMVQLAIEIAKKIVRREVTVDREIVVTLARVALSRLHNRALATVRLHPEDHEYVSARREKLGTQGTVQLIEDASIHRGGCLIETDFGDVDARIEQQFHEIERGFLNDLSV